MEMSRSKYLLFIIVICTVLFSFYFIIYDDTILFHRSYFNPFHEYHNNLSRKLQRTVKKGERSRNKPDIEENSIVNSESIRTGTRHRSNRLGTHKKASTSSISGSGSSTILPSKQSVSSITIANLNDLNNLKDLAMDPQWSNIAMPNKSYFAGFDPPHDIQRWKLAQLQASRGDQVLLSKVLEVIQSPFDYIPGSSSFKWIHHLVEHHKSKKHGYLRDLVHVKGQRAPIIMFGRPDFDRPGYEGNVIGFNSLNPDEMHEDKEASKIPRKVVAIGSMDENWGWLSTYFLNRTVPWTLSLSKHPNPWDSSFPYCDTYMSHILDDPNLIALFVNQHHNCSHPKVLSFPLGINEPKSIWMTIQTAKYNFTKKDQLIFSAGSNYAFRPFIRQCIANNMGSDMIIDKRLTPEQFRMKIVTSMYVLCMPGLGYDSYRLWETLGSGSIPVIERGFGMDRTFYKLPVLLLDDFAELTSFTLRQAYLEALYLADNWEYERISRRYWQSLVYEVAETASIQPMLTKHPMHASDLGFTRPLVPYDCDMMGGCGNGTKRTPKKYCAIDPSVMKPGYNWVWDHSIGDTK